ncbi:HtaA domain-containing protein [Auritidibacter ignavus]|uniref:HtaA domain-containing protein n=1 Tax=Auritidibacter ignavus TaxID=678932 RepID=UPI000F024859|nr:HtaA domain-containing protein [Auritidibacter ignavus]NIH72051.1 hypothetical protein [Auritidibacter ignavus]RMX23936.1 hypothetical protein DYI20_02035 [Auritidibacter ignavus]
MQNKITRLLGGVAGIALLAGGLTATDANADQNLPVSDVQFSWAVNEEAGGGAFFGGANWLVAGEVGNVHGDQNRGATVWDEKKDAKYFTNRDGNVTITRPDAQGNQVPATWAARNFESITADGEPAGNRLKTAPGSSSWNQANIAAGSGTVDPEGENAEISWDGSFTTVFYGGMTYWSINDPKLTVTNGKGELTATLTGYGADMYDLSKWVKLDPMHNATVATFSDVDVTETGIEIKPDYLGVAVEVEANGPSNPQKREGKHWGSFPQDTVDFNVGTGQAGYWYSTGGQVDPKKPAAPISVSYPKVEAPAQPTPEHEDCTTAGAADGENTECVDTDVTIPDADQNQPGPGNPGGPDEGPGDGDGDDTPTGAFKLTIEKNQTSLGQGEVDQAGGVVASGRLPEATVLDTRSNSQGWNVTGQASAFQNAAGTESFGAAALGWVPRVTQTGQTARAGAEVKPNVENGLAANRTLATATGATGEKTTLGAELNLNVLQQNIPSGGNYRSVLTVTAIAK